LDRGPTHEQQLEEQKPEPVVPHGRVHQPDGAPGGGIISLFDLVFGGVVTPASPSGVAASSGGVEASLAASFGDPANIVDAAASSGRPMARLTFADDKLVQQPTHVLHPPRRSCFPISWFELLYEAQLGVQERMLDDSVHKYWADRGFDVSLDDDDMLRIVAHSRTPDALAEDGGGWLGGVHQFSRRGAFQG